MIISLAYEQFFLFGNVQKAHEKRKKEKLMLERRKDSSELRAAPWNKNFFHYLFWTRTTDFAEKEALLVIDSILHYSGKIKRQGSVSFA